MTTAWVVLYLLNVYGGAPLALRQYDTMEQCRAAQEGAVQYPKDIRTSYSMVCVPVFSE